MTSADEVMEHQLQTGNEEVMTKAQLMRMKKEVAFKPFYNESQQRVQQAGFEPSYRLNAPIIDLTADDGGGKPKVASKILPAKSRLGVEKNGKSPVRLILCFFILTFNRRSCRVSTSSPATNSSAPGTKNQQRTHRHNAVQTTSQAPAQANTESSPLSVCSFSTVTEVVAVCADASRWAVSSV